MTNGISVLEIIGGIAMLTTITTAASGFYMKKNSDRTDETMKKVVEHTKISIDEIKNAMNTNSKETRSDYKDLVSHIDDRIERIYSRMESNSAELKEYISQEVAQLKAKDYDQDVKIDHARDKLHGYNEDLLRFKLEVSEKYRRKDDTINETTINNNN